MTDAVPGAYALTCEWLELCEATAAGMAAHPIHGVIPVCRYHADMYRIPLITPRKDH